MRAWWRPRAATATPEAASGPPAAAAPVRDHRVKPAGVLDRKSVV